MEVMGLLMRRNFGKSLGPQTIYTCASPGYQGQAVRQGVDQVISLFQTSHHALAVAGIHSDRETLV
jgi:hypothetical protein